eukprot:2179182-Prymnesium_polylepis.1
MQTDELDFLVNDAEQKGVSCTLTTLTLVVWWTSLSAPLSITRQVLPFTTKKARDHLSEAVEAQERRRAAEVQLHQLLTKDNGQQRSAFAVDDIKLHSECSGPHLKGSRLLAHLRLRFARSTMCTATLGWARESGVVGDLITTADAMVTAAKHASQALVRLNVQSLELLPAGRRREESLSEEELGELGSSIQTVQKILVSETERARADGFAPPDGHDQVSRQLQEAANTLTQGKE